MLITEWNTEEATAVAREEAWEEGVGIGITRTAKNMLAKGYSVAEVIGVTNLSHEQIMALR